MNWNQIGMPSALVSHMGLKRELAECKSVLNEAQNHVMQPVDVGVMAEKLVESGGREFVTLVRGLTLDLEATKRELENANRRCERMREELTRSGVDVDENGLVKNRDDSRAKKAVKKDIAKETTEVSVVKHEPKDEPKKEPPSILDGQAVWEEWDRRFKALLG